MILTLQAISALEGATRVQPIAPLFLLLGKTQMKSRLWNDAVDSFQKALDIIVRICVVGNKDVLIHVQDDVLKCPLIPETP